MAEVNQTAQGQNQAQEQQFSIQKLYLKDVSFESPNVPAVFTEGEWQPEVNIQLNSSNQAIGQDTYEVDLKITVTAKQNKKTAFLVELTQSGIFSIAGFDAENLRGMLGAFCPETIFPFAREAIAEVRLAQERAVGHVDEPVRYGNAHAHAVGLVTPLVFVRPPHPRARAFAGRVDPRATLAVLREREGAKATPLVRRARVVEVDGIRVARGQLLGEVHPNGVELAFAAQLDGTE